MDLLTCHDQINGARQLLALDAQTALDLAIIAGLYMLDADAALAGGQARSVVGKAGGLAPFRRQVEHLILARDLDATVVDGSAIATQQLGAIAHVEQRGVGFHVHLLRPGERICKSKKK